MASSFRLTAVNWTSTKAAIIGRMTSTSLEALEAGKQAIISHAVAAAPSPKDEETAMRQWEEASGTLYHPKNDEAESSRVHFQKNGSAGQLYIQEALLSPEIQDAIFIPFNTERRDGFYLGRLNFLDNITRFSWVNAVYKKGGVETFGEFVSKIGTFSSFEYGAKYIVPAVHGSMISPKAGIAIKGGGVWGERASVLRRVQARPMFSSITRDLVVGAMTEVLEQVDLK